MLVSRSKMKRKRFDSKRAHVEAFLRTFPSRNFHRILFSTNDILSDLLYLHGSTSLVFLSNERLLCFDVCIPHVYTDQLRDSHSDADVAQQERILT